MELLQNLLKKEAKSEGFIESAVVDLDLAPSFENHAHRYTRWLQSNLWGEMQYLQRGEKNRIKPRKLYPKCESVFCVLARYSSKPIGNEKTPRYARYIKGILNSHNEFDFVDYHESVSKKLENVLIRVRDEWLKISNIKLEWKINVDSSAVLERTWANLSGLGWLGKSTMLLNKKHGSYFFIGVAYLSLKTNQPEATMANLCGNCSRCIDACPTGAIIEPNWLDAKKCISYWTLEKRGELVLDQADQKNLGTWVAGCDICQEVCPFNQKPTKQESSQEEKISSNEFFLKTWTELLNETEESYRQKIKKTALTRIKPTEFFRNIKNALSNFSERR